MMIKSYEDIVTDTELWFEAVKSVKKIEKPKTVKKSLKTVRIKVKPKERELPVLNVSRGTLLKGDVKAIDASTANRFTKGKMRIDSKLDLHGFTSDKAYIALRNFIISSYAKGARCLLVITGKGKRKEDEIGRMYSTGVIREMLPKWLNYLEIRPYILSFSTAQIKDGGEGAVYIYLKRQNRAK